MFEGIVRGGGGGGGLGGFFYSNDGTLVKVKVFTPYFFFSPQKLSFEQSLNRQANVVK